MGKPYRGVVQSFGAPVMLRRPGAERPQDRLEARWIPGIWLGKQSNSDDHIGLIKDALLVTRSCKSLMDRELGGEVVNQLFKTSALPVLMPELAQRPGPEPTSAEQQPVPTESAPDARKRLHAKTRLFHEEAGPMKEYSACACGAPSHTGECQE